MRGAVVAKVVASKSKGLVVGDYVTATAGWTEYAVLNEKHVEKTEIPANGKTTDALGVLG